ncbi:MAG TPA: hypothetical protein VE944_08630 [Nostoc sp.]|uniref:hypothetical protein n=1 Tax=Nostoc sp. TaxID=1180 RepID=UPI002D2C8484|nr:hypothetical protein [Nostoc sp.]HYX14416.1 hypothetical protein [Nostoc sp.]
MGLKPHPKEFKRVKIAIAAIAISKSCFYPNAIAKMGNHSSAYSWLHQTKDF